MGPDAGRQGRVAIAPRAGPMPGHPPGRVKLQAAYRCADFFVAQCRATDENRSTHHPLDCRTS
jgi:hypothetical protein